MITEEKALEIAKEAGFRNGRSHYPCDCELDIFTRALNLAAAMALEKVISANWFDATTQEALRGVEQDYREAAKVEMK